MAPAWLASRSRGDAPSRSAASGSAPGCSSRHRRMSALSACCGIRTLLVSAALVNGEVDDFSSQSSIAARSYLREKKVPAARY